jgi:hypothetical protein
MQISTSVGVIQVILRSPLEDKNAGSNDNRSGEISPFRTAIEPEHAAGVKRTRTCTAEDEADQRRSGAQPGYHRAFEAKAGADPTEVAVRCCPDFKSAGARSRAWIRHVWGPFCYGSRQGP